jgi:hypothetical protein
MQNKGWVHKNKIKKVLLSSSALFPFCRLPLSRCQWFSGWASENSKLPHD